jgi:hypothetical protein
MEVSVEQARQALMSEGGKLSRYLSQGLTKLPGVVGRTRSKRLGDPLGRFGGPSAERELALDEDRAK